MKIQVIIKYRYIIFKQKMSGDSSKIDQYFNQQIQDISFITKANKNSIDYSYDASHIISRVSVPKFGNLRILNRKTKMKMKK